MPSNLLESTSKSVFFMTATPLNCMPAFLHSANVLRMFQTAFCLDTVAIKDFQHAA